MSHLIEYGTQFLSGGGSQADVDAIVASGARYVRIGIDFAFVYDPQSDYTGDTPDYAGGADGAFMLMCKAAGLKVIAQLIYCPPWLLTAFTTYPYGPPNDFDVWATMCARAYRDLHGVVDAWSVWNEPNNWQFWRDPASASWRYPLLLRKAVTAMRTQAVAMGHGWAAPFIIGGELSTGGSGTQEWVDRWDRGTDPNAAEGPGTLSMGCALDKLFNATTGIVPGRTVNTPYVDAYGIHPYTWGLGRDGVLNHFFESPMVHCWEHVPVGSTPFSFWEDIISAHESYSPWAPPADHKKIWATEYGFPATAGLYETNGTEADAAAGVDTALSYWEWHAPFGAGPLIHFPYKDTYPASGDAIARFGGMVRNDNSPKQMRTTFRAHATAYAPPAHPDGAVNWSDGSYKWSSPLLTWNGGIIGQAPPPPDPGASDYPDVSIELGIHPRADSGNFVVLGNRARGLGSSARLGPTHFFYEVGRYVEEFTVDQGRNEGLAEPTAGGLVTKCHNTDRRFDIRNASGPYWPHLNRPRAKLRLSLDGVPWITTDVDQLSPTYFDFNKAYVDLGGHDALALLANAPVKYHARQQSTQGRVNRILDHAGFRGHRDIRPGTFTLGDYQVDSTALAELATLEDVEQALVLVGPDGTLVFTDRSYLTATPAFLFSDDGTGDADYQSVDYDPGLARFWNRTTVTRKPRADTDHPVPQSFTDERSVRDYGIVQRPGLDDSPVLNDGWAALQAALIGARDTRPIPRIDSVTLTVADFPRSKRIAFGLLAPGVVVKVRHHPVGGGTPAFIEQRSLIVGRKLAGTNGEPTSITATWYFRSLEAS